MMMMMMFICSLQADVENQASDINFINFNILIFSICPISRLKIFIYKNMEQEMISGSCWFACHSMKVIH